MPREIKTPVRYIMEDITPVKRPVLPTPPADLQPLKSKRGRPKSVSLDREPVTPSLSSRPSPRKSSESIIIPDDDDSDIEIIEPPKPSKRKKDDDPDWAVERKSKTSRSSRDRARREKPPTNISPPVSAATTPTATVASKGETPQKPFTVNLFMECREEPLSLAQLTAMKKEQAQYELSQSLVRAAREGRLIFLPDGGTKILDKPMVFAPPTPVIAAAPPIVAAPQSTPSSGLISQINLRNRSQSPDLLIIGETPPKMTPPVTLISPPVANVSKVTPANKVTAVNKVAAVNNVAPVNKAAPLSKVAPVNNVAPLSKVAPAPTAPPAGTLVQGTHGLGIRLPTGWQMVPVTTSATPAVKDATPVQAHTRNVGPKSVTSLRTKVQSEVLPPLRQVQQQQQQIQSRSDSEFQKKKLKKPALSEEDESGNWVPLDEYYYGKMEGNPTYQEAKGEHRFKCWYCNKMLYNNVAAMMHIQGHIDSERQVNLDLSDLTQCKHCYKQFDTPFEMQTHIEKVHMNNANVLLCRICERNHDSRQALKEHMRKSHNACEMPYICQLCKFRSSMYSDVVDHFKKKHNGSDAVLCMYCLRVFHVKFVSQGWGQTSIFYNHLMKHQVKNSCKKCQLCRLVFLNLGDVKMHRKMDHLSNQKGVIGMNAKYTTPDQVMIKVTEKTELSLAVGGVKSLNVPAVKKIMDHRLSFPPFVSRMKCIECQVFMGSPDHFRKFIQCSMCRFATSCSFAYSNHMMGFHSGQMTSAASHTPDESKLESKLYCSCGFVSNYGNRIANHLVFCSKSSCFKDPPAPCTADEFGHELQDPRKKPDASLLDVLGLIKKDSLAPLSARTPHLDSPPSEPVDMPEVPLSAKLGKKPLLLRDSLKKTFKSVFKSDKDKNIFERVKFGDDSLITEKQTDRVNLSSLKHDLKKVELPVSGEITTRVEGERQAKSGVEEKVTATETTGKDKTAIEGSNVSQQPNTAVKTSPMKLAKELDEILKDPCEKEKDSAVSASIEDCLLIGTDSDGNESNNTDKEVNNSLRNIVSQRQETVADVDLESHQVKDAGVEHEPAKIDTGCDLVTDSVTESDSAKDDRTESDSAKDDRTESDSAKDDRTESDSTKDDRTESDSAKDDRTESDSTKDDRTESDSAKNSETAKNSVNFENIDSAKNRDVECESDIDHSAESELTKTANADESTKTDDVESVLTKTDDVESVLTKTDDVESVLTKTDDVESVLTKTDDVESVLTKTDDVESELTKIDDIESESTKIGDVESESTKIDDTERESVNIDDMESESTKISDMESNSTKIDVIESELTEIDYHESKSTKIDDLESESTKIDDTESESIKIDDMERESTKIDDFESESTKIYDTESESVKIDDMESESNKIDDLESESIKIDDTESESVKIDDMESESTKIDYTKAVSTTVDFTESESTIIDDIESESTKIDDMESESNKIDGMESESNKIGDMESESTKIDCTKAVSTTVDFTESESTIIDDIESESTKIDDMESESSKIDDMERESSKIDDMESESNKIGDMESESTNISDMENELTKIDYTKAVSTTFDFTESESTKIGDVENEATRIGDIESQSATFGDMESESATIGDMESESTKTDHMESELTKDDDLESESTNNGIDRDVTEIDQTEYESFKNDDVESESFKNDDVESESFKNYDVESESFKNDDVESESIKNDDTELAKEDDVEIEFTKNNDFENESAKDGDIGYVSPKSGDVEVGPPAKTDVTDIESATEDVSLEAVKNCDAEGELNHDAECETARHDAENVKDKDNSDSGNAVSTDSRVTSGLFEQDQHVQAHATEVGSSSPGLDKYEQDEQHRSCIETETEITDFAEPKHDSAMLCETDVRDNVDCDNQSDTKVMINEASSADIVDEDIVDNNAHSTPVLSGQAGVDDEEIADDEQGLSLGSGEGTALCTIRDKVSETDVPGSLIKDHDDCELDSVSKDLKPGDNNSLQPYQQEYQDQENSPGISELLKSSSDSHHGSEATSKPADFEDNLSQQESSRAEEPTFTSAGGDVGWVSSKESLFSSQSGMSQNSCVSQGSDRSQFPAASDRDEGVDRLGSSISSNQDQGREDESHQVASPVADLKISTSEESLPPYPSQQPHQIQPGSSDLQREPSVSSSAPSHSRSDRSHQRRSRSRSQDRRRERRSKSRDRDQDRDRHRNRDRDRHRDRRSRSRDRDRLDDRDRYNRDRHRDRSREKDRHRDRSRERDRGRDWDRNRDRDYYRHKDDRRYR